MPTVAQLMADPDDLGRLAMTVAAGAVLAAGGRALALQSPVVIEVGASALAALSEHGVITDLLPRWALLRPAARCCCGCRPATNGSWARIASARRQLVTMR